MPKKAAKDSNVYIKHPQYAWVPAKLERQEGDKAYVSVAEYSGEQQIGMVPTKKYSEQVVNLKDYAHKVLPLQNVDANGSLALQSDMIHLSYLHEVGRAIRIPVTTRFVLPEKLTFAWSFFHRPPFCTISSDAMRREIPTPVLEISLSL